MMLRSFFEDVRSDVRTLISWIKAFPKRLADIQKPILSGTLLENVESSFLDKQFYEEPNINDLDVIPDYPIDFGRKTSWFAVRSTDTEAVIETLQLSEVNQANWNSGFYFGRRSKSRYWVFVTPPINDWTIIHVHLIFSECEEKAIEVLSSLSREFGECQYFVSFRNTSHASWWLAFDGEVRRGFQFICEYKTNIGKTTSAEIEIGLPDISGVSIENLNQMLNEVEVTDWDENVGAPLEHLYFKNEHYLKRLVEDEEDVFKVAEKWSLNPQLLSKVDNQEPMIGYVGYLPR